MIMLIVLFTLLVEGTDIYGAPNTCLGEPNGFPCVSGSNDYYYVYSCDDCKSGYIEKSIDSCKGTVSYCEEDPNAVCTDLIANCIACDETNKQKCKSCKQGFSLDSSGICVMEGGPFGQYGCSSTTDYVMCDNMVIYSCSTYCESGYVKKQITTSCGTLDYCDKIQCNVQNCRECSSTNYCSSCYSGYHAENGKCVKDETPSEESSENEYDCNVLFCTQCDYENHCSMCSPGYQVSNGDCEKIICYASYCEECYSNDKYKCKTCEDGLYNLNGECKIYCDASNCEECYYNDKNKCRICKEGYYNLNETCVDDYVCDDNCEKCYYQNDYTYCKICKKGYYESYGACYKCMDNCAKCHNSIECMECEQSYALEGSSCTKIPENGYDGDYTCSSPLDCNEEYSEDGYQYVANSCYNMNEKCSNHSSFRLVHEVDYSNPYVVFYSERDCDGNATIEFANYCNSGHLLFMLLAIILIALI